MPETIKKNISVVGRFLPSRGDGSTAQSERYAMARLRPFYGRRSIALLSARSVRRDGAPAPGRSAPGRRRRGTGSRRPATRTYGVK